MIYLLAGFVIGAAVAAAIILKKPDDQITGI